MLKYIVKRLILMIPVVIGIVCIVFTIMYLSPGDPARMILGDRATQEQVEVLREEMGLNDPYIVQFGRYVKDAASGDFGRSYTNNIPVMETISQRFPNTVLLAVCGMILSVLIGVPIGILTSIFMAEYCPAKIYRPLKAATELLAGIPSVVYGFFGMLVLVPFIRETTGSKGNVMLTACILLGIMILPTIIGTTESALRSVTRTYYEGALALGATKERTIFTVMLPAAKSGVLTGVVLGIGRAIGETMAVIMIAGNQTAMPTSLLKGVRTLTANIVLEMGYATGLHREALIATAVVLFVFILIINLSVSLLRRGQNAGD